MIPSTAILGGCGEILEKVTDLKRAIEEACGDSTPPPARPAPASCSPYNWTSVSLTEFGSSNLQHAGTLSFTIPNAVPSSAREILIHAGAVNGNDHRIPYHNLKIFTQIGTTRYEKYLLLYGWRQEAANTNSDNMWFPMPPNRRVYLTVYASHGGNAMLRLYAIGYR